MRDFVVFAIVFGSLPFIFKRPVIGVLMFTWLSLMNPHRLAYGAAYAFPFAAVVAAATIISLILTSQTRHLRVTPVVIILIVFMMWTTFTSLFALEADLAWAEWNRVMKTMLMILVAMVALNTKQDIKAFALVVALSIGFYGAKGGIFTVLSGGSYRVFGPALSYIADNNDLALAMVTTLPLIWYLRSVASSFWFRLAFLGLALATLIAIVGSYSRGSFLAAGVMLAFLWLKSRAKITTGLVLVVVVSFVLLTMPEKWFERMSTIDDYKEDASAMGRINAWEFAINVANSSLTGGGFAVFTPRMFVVYAPDPLDSHAAHSIYFQVLGEHGYIGLMLFLALMLATWLTARNVRKLTETQADKKWAFDLVSMCQVSIIGYAAGGAFLTLAYFDLYYDLITLIVALEKWLYLDSKKVTQSGEFDPILVASRPQGSSQ